VFKNHGKVLWGMVETLWKNKRTRKRSESLWSEGDVFLVGIYLGTSRISAISIRSIDAIGVESLLATILGMGRGDLRNLDWEKWVLSEGSKGGRRKRLKKKEREKWEEEVQ